MDEEIFDGFVSIDPDGEQEETAALISEVPSCKGVILFADSANNPIQLLTGANLRRTAKVRIIGNEQETATKRPDIAQIAGRIYYKCCYNNFLSMLEHFRIAKNLFPGNYRDFITLPKLSLVKIDTAAKWPEFSVVSGIAAKSGEKIFGPFSSRKSANDYISILEDAFSLCTRPDLVDNPEKAASCPYLQMGTCPTPCVGKISKEQYFRQIDKAITAACGHRDHLYTVMEKEMERYSENMEFEAASEVKKKIELLKQLDTRTYEWTAEIENMSILHIDKSAKIREEGKRGKTQTFAAFYITAGKVRTLEPFTLENFAEFYKSIPMPTPRSAINNAGIDRPAEQNLRTANELLALVSYFLYRGNRAGVWMNLVKGIPGKDEMQKRIDEEC